jgi:2'-5' RNA ligase
MHALVCRPARGYACMSECRAVGAAGRAVIDPQNMQLTLRFIGDVPEPDGRDLSLALSEIHGPAFDLALSGIGHFDRRGNVHSV